jgi:hypothetical protein
MNVFIINNYPQIPMWTSLFREKDVTPSSSAIYGFEVMLRNLEWSTSYNCLSMVSTNLTNQLSFFQIFSIFVVH